MNYKVVIDPRAILDIQDAVDYYDSKKDGLGHEFYTILEEHFEILVTNPSFQIKYKDYHGYRFVHSHLFYFTT